MTTDISFVLFAQRLADEHSGSVRLLTHARNLGYGAALRKMIDSKPPRPWLPLQSVAGRSEGSREAAESVEAMHSCIDLSLRPSPARASFALLTTPRRPQGHADPESII
jgi:hypothetical protein